MSETYDPEVWRLSEHREWMKTIAEPLLNVTVEVDGVVLPSSEVERIMNGII